MKQLQISFIEAPRLVSPGAIMRLPPTSNASETGIGSLL
jgi:hypothetical protein